MTKKTTNSWSSWTEAPVKFQGGVGGTAVASGGNGGTLQIIGNDGVIRTAHEMALGDSPSVVTIKTVDPPVFDGEDYSPLNDDHSDLGKVGHYWRTVRANEVLVRGMPVATLDDLKRSNQDRMFDAMLGGLLAIVMLWALRWWYQQWLRKAWLARQPKGDGAPNTRGTRGPGDPQF